MAISKKNKRDYVRMDTVFPVELAVVDGSEEKSSHDLLQGFTRDISTGGMCIEIKSFNREAEKALLDLDTILDLTINPPFSRHPIKALARIAWSQKHEEILPIRYLIGISYTSIDKRAKNRIIQYARRVQWVPRLTIVFIVLMALSLLGLFVHSQQLVKENKQLVTQLVESAEKKSEVSSDLFQLQKRKTNLDSEFRQAQQKIKQLEDSLASLTTEGVQQKQTYQTELTQVLERQKVINKELQVIQSDRERLKETYGALKKTEELTATSGLQQMYKWLKSHQNLRTGLVASFEGDPQLEGFGFTYDQSLVAQAFLIFGDIENAKSILSFYKSKAKKTKGAYANAYSVMSGSITEYMVHTGPNIWIGIAALQYEKRMKDGEFVGLAQDIGNWTIQMQDSEGGVTGGPDITWHSTEHNLDAYSLFSMLHEITGEEKYAKAQVRVLDWIKKYAYSGEEGRINRGKGDATIATDTFSWAVAAIGATKLFELEFDPEEIMNFVQEHCEVEVVYRQPSGKIAKARGFDFAKAQNIGRGGVISTEWTAQVIITYQILSRYFESIGNRDRATLYQEKSDFYLNELQKLIITSPSKTGQGRGCLPYASMDNVDTGHGWRTPKGARTGSVSGTAYGLFAWVGYNPFNLENEVRVS